MIRSGAAAPGAVLGRRLRPSPESKTFTEVTLKKLLLATIAALALPSLLLAADVLTEYKLDHDKVVVRPNPRSGEAVA